MDKYLTIISDKEEKLKHYKALKTDEEKENFFKEVLLELEDIRIQKRLIEEEYRLEKSRRFARKSEKTYPNAVQLSFSDLDELVDPNMDVFNEVEDIATRNQEPITETITYTRRKPNKNNSKNKNIEVRIINHKLEDNDCVCKRCGNQLSEIGYTEVKTYEFIPAKLVLNSHREYSYKCQNCSTDLKDSIFKVKRETSFPKLMVEDSFVSHIIVEKYLKHVPLYRQEKVMNNYGLEVSRKNFSNWMLKAANILKPLFDLMHQDILNSQVCHMDETPLRVLNENQEKCYIWGLCSSKYDKPIFLYFFKENRKHNNATDILKGFNGYVHSDGYKAYQKIDNVIDVACFAHARRKYVELLKVINDDSYFATILKEGKSYIDKLYRIEKDIANLSIQEKYEQRQLLSKPIVEQYFKWCENNPIAGHKQLGVNKAIAYSLNIKNELQHYLLDGRLEIDNNRAERMLKNFVIGRKNFLFCISDGGAEATSILYSIVETAYENKLRVEDYLTYVFKTLPKLKTDEYHSLLPYSDDIPTTLKLQSE